jgi:hypothetical protein
MVNTRRSDEYKRKQLQNDEIRYMNKWLRNGLIHMTIRAATIVVTGIVLNHIRKSNKQ